MLSAFTVKEDLLSPIPPSADPNQLAHAVWIDLVNPTTEEIKTVETFSGIALPKIQETKELEASSHYEVYPTGFQINCLFLVKVEETFENITAAFLCNNRCLISLCSREIPTIRQLQRQWQTGTRLKNDPVSTIVALLEIKIDRLADMSEEAYLSIEKISHQIFQRDNNDLEETIDNLSIQDDLIGKIRLCLMDGQRDLNFVLRRGHLTEDNIKNVNDMLEDIKTLLTHNTFLSERIDFLLNAALGFINIEQNKIIKIFSIAAVVLMPPTVIASIYGMNFHGMPELSWKWGYPLSLLLMVLAGISPYLFFKRKGWL
ncbi:magnesium/cobalt transporter CorA [bacterium]|nr:magnesium/cobalt transporter CorA [bacterium]